MNLEFLNPLRWKKSFLILVLSSFVFVWFAFIDTYSIKTRWEMASRKVELIEQTEALNRDALEIQQRIEDLENDPALLEKIAREEYGMRKPGEKVYKIKKVGED